MAEILVGELADETVASLEELAKRRHRSLEGEVRALLEEVVERERRRKDFLVKVERLQAEFAGRPTTDSVELLHEGRAEWEEKWGPS